MNDSITWMTVAEVAERLRITRGTVYKMINTREIAHHRNCTGKRRGKNARIRIKLEDVIEYEKKHRIEATLN